jgi:hypothetical protein
MGGAYDMHRRGRNAYKALVRSLKNAEHLEDHRVDGRIILKWILKLGWEDVCRIPEGQDRNQ